MLLLGIKTNYLKRYYKGSGPKMDHWGAPAIISDHIISDHEL